MDNQGLAKRASRSGNTSSSASPDTKFPRHIIIIRGALFAAIWWILVDGDTSSLVVGIPALGIALWVSTALLPPVPINYYELAKFIPFFVRLSLVGGFDVARRVLYRDIPITPGLIDYPVKLPPGISRQVLANIVSLLPGTLSAKLSPHHLTVHVLDAEKDILAELALVESAIARVFSKL